jgi:aminoglycoside phosphotransferase (APT) family kinase protein
MQNSLSLPRLHHWLEKQVDGLGPLENFTAERLPAGQSNPTWLLGNGTRQWVMRTKPAPVAQLLPSAHAIEREVSVLRALAPTEVPVPRVYALCEDESIIGVAFYVMDFVQGRIIRDTTLPQQTPAQRREMHASALKVMAALHCVDWDSVGLSQFGKHEHFFERMIQRWSKQYLASTDQPQAAMQSLMAWLPAHIPANQPQENNLSLVHGDFRLENLVFDPQQPLVTAVLDWELSTLGHPLADLSYHCMAWHLPPGILRGISGVDLRTLGIPSEEEVIDQYCQLTQRQDAAQIKAHWHFYLACNLFRLAAILQGIQFRIDKGMASHPQAIETARMAPVVADLALKIIHQKTAPTGVNP